MDLFAVLSCRNLTMFLSLVFFCLLENKKKREKYNFKSIKAVWAIQTYFPAKENVDSSVNLFWKACLH